VRPPHGLIVSIEFLADAVANRLDVLSGIGQRLGLRARQDPDPPDNLHLSSYCVSHQLGLVQPGCCIRPYHPQDHSAHQQCFHDSSPAMDIFRLPYSSAASRVNFFLWLAHSPGKWTTRSETWSAVPPFLIIFVLAPLIILQKCQVMPGSLLRPLDHGQMPAVLHDHGCAIW